MDEPYSDALRSWLAQHEVQLVASRLLSTELMRAVRRRIPQTISEAQDLLTSVLLLDLEQATLDSAAMLDPPWLRSLDAIHLSAALELGGDLEGIVTYDHRLADAARLHGIEVIAPG